MNILWIKVTNINEQKEMNYRQYIGKNSEISYFISFNLRQISSFINNINAKSI